LLEGCGDSEEDVAATFSVKGLPGALEGALGGLDGKINIFGRGFLDGFDQGVGARVEQLAGGGEGGEGGLESVVDEWAGEACDGNGPFGCVECEHFGMDGETMDGEGV